MSSKVVLTLPYPHFLGSSCLNHYGSLSQDCESLWERTSSELVSCLVIQETLGPWRKAGCSRSRDWVSYGSDSLYPGVLSVAQAYVWDAVWSCGLRQTLAWVHSWEGAGLGNWPWWISTKLNSQEQQCRWAVSSHEAIELRRTQVLWKTSWQAGLQRDNKSSSCCSWRSISTWVSLSTLPPHCFLHLLIYNSIISTATSHGFVIWMLLKSSLSF